MSTPFPPVVGRVETWHAQDGCDARVLTSARTGAANPDAPLGTLKSKNPEPPSFAFRSRLTVTHDDGRVETPEADDVSSP
jgi:hypothetical protein